MASQLTILFNIFPTHIFPSHKLIPNLLKRSVIYRELKNLLPSFQAFYGNLSAVDLHGYLPNVEWDIESTTAEHHRIFYTCCPDDKYSDLTFSLVLARQWRFYSMFLLLPAIILSCMSLMIFCIPPGRPDRTGLGKLDDCVLTEQD